MKGLLAGTLAAVVALAPVMAVAAPAPIEDSGTAVGPQPAPTPEPAGHPPGHGMVVAGTVITLGSVAAYGLLGAGLAIGNRAELEIASLGERDDIQERRALLLRGTLGNRLAVAGGIVAAVAVVVGIPLIVIGRRRATAASGSRGRAHTQQRRLSLGVQGAGAFVRLRH